MKPFGPLFLLGATFGALSATASSAIAAVDTSQWKCESCPFDKAGTSATLDVGVGAVSDNSTKFGDYTGLNKKGGFLVAGGAARYVGGNGVFGSVNASDLGLESRSLAAEVGQEGLYTLRLGYAEIPRHLASTQQAGEVGYKRSRFDAGVSWIIAPQWSTRVSLRHDVRDGTQRGAGSFFSSASQLAAPVDQVTDQLEVSTSYFTPGLQATLGYQGSLFRNGTDSLTWTNPFLVVPGSDRGQLALAPDNESHQVSGSAGYEISPQIRASGEFAVGRMTQDAAYVNATLNTTDPGLAAAALAVPAQSLQGRVDTFNGSVRVTATPIDALRLNASYARDVRDNRTPSASYPAVSTDMFLGTVPRINQRFNFKQDRFKLNADYRGGPGNLKTSIGAEQDNRDRTLQEVVTTRETTFWGRASAQAREDLSLSLKLAHAERRSSTYGVATWVNPPENPLLRKFNLAARSRNSAGLRADATVAENVNIGFNADWANDDYTESTIGLLDGHSVNVGADASIAISDQTQLHLFAQGERIRSRQAGSEVFATPDWSARNKDMVDMAGAGVKHVALKGKLELGADLTFSRSRSDVTIYPAAGSAFPAMKTSRDSLRLLATYRLNDQLSVLGSYWYERYDAQDWHLDGVLPTTVPNLLAFGEQAPRYTVNVVRVAVRYWF